MKYAVSITSKKKKKCATIVQATWKKQLFFRFICLASIEMYIQISCILFLK